MKSSLKYLWLIIDVILMITTFITVVVIPTETYLNKYLILSIIILNIFLALLFRNQIMNFLRSSFWKFIVNHLIQATLVLLILMLVNYWGVKINKYKDFSIQNLNSLSEQSVHLSKSVSETLKITLFAKRADWEKYLTLLNMYRWHNPLIQVSAVDIETEPAKVASLGIESNGTILVEYQKRKIKGIAIDEKSITNLLLRVLRESIINIYYTTGHGELDPKNIDAEGLTYLAEQLRYSTYQLKPLDLSQIDNIPLDANLILILGPKNDFLGYEWEKVFSYFHKGGSVFLSLAPFFDKKIHQGLITKLKNDFSVNVVNSLVLDRLSTIQGKDASVSIVNQFNKNHPATQELNQRIIYPMSLALKFEKNDSYMIDSLLETTPLPGSWAETNFRDLSVGKAVFDAKDDIPGPISLMLSIEDKKNLGRFVIAGSSSYFVNAYQGQSGNFNLMLNLISWLSHDEGIISLNRPELIGDKIIMSEEQIRMIFIISIVATPILMIILASWFFIRRRKGL